MCRRNSLPSIRLVRACHLSLVTHIPPISLLSLLKSCGVSFHTLFLFTKAGAFVIFLILDLRSLKLSPLFLYTPFTFSVSSFMIVVTKYSDIYNLRSSQIETNMVSEQKANFIPTVMNITGSVAANCCRYRGMQFSKNLCLTYCVPNSTSWNLTPTEVGAR
jgi:hypothetical protein